MSKPAPPTEENQGGQRPQGRSRGLTARSPGAPGNNPRPSNYTSFPSPSLSFLFPLFFSVILFSAVFPLCLVLARLCWLLPPLYRVLGGGGVHPPFTHNTGRGTSSLSSSQAGSPPACGPSCVSAWRRGWGSIPCRWYTGMARHRCAFSGA